MRQPFEIGHNVLRWQETDFTVIVSQPVKGSLLIIVEPDCLSLQVHLESRTSELIQVMFGHTNPTACPGYRKRGYMRFLIGLVDELNLMYGVRACELEDKSTFVEEGIETAPYLFVHRGWPLYTGYGFMYNAGAEDVFENIQMTNDILSRVWYSLQERCTNKLLDQYYAARAKQRETAAYCLTFPKYQGEFVGKWNEKMRLPPDATYGLTLSNRDGLFFVGTASQVIDRGIEGSCVFVKREDVVCTTTQDLFEEMVYFCDHPSPLQESVNIRKYWQTVANVSTEQCLGLSIRDFLRQSRPDSLCDFLLSRCGLQNAPFTFVKYYDKDGRDLFCVRGGGQSSPPVLTGLVYQ